MLKHLMNHWKTHRQKSPYVVSDDPFCCTDLSLGGSPDKNIYSVNRVNPIYQNSDSEESSSKSGNCRVKSDLKDVYKPQCSTCGFYPSTLSYPITRTLGDIYAPPSLLSSEIYQPFMEKKTSGEDGRDVSLRPQFNRRLTNNTKVADKVVPFLYDSQFQNSYGDFRTKRKRNIIDFHGPVSSETEDSGIQVGNSCASSLENEETAETGGVRYSLQSYNKNGISLIEPVICLKHDHLSVSKRVRKGHERNLSFSQPCVVRVKEQQMNSSSRKAKEQPDTFNETLDSGSREEQMKTYKDREEDTENVLDVDESLESEAAFATKNKDFNESQQFLNDVEKSTNQIKETPEFKAHKNSVISSESQLEFTSCNSELPHNPSVKGPKSPFSTRTSWHVCDQDGIGHLKQIPKLRNLIGWSKCRICRP
ncbi:uncharacterized protein LOC143238804 [Tachypleus tridentatus]|uniref:uncharacterized protein LOC143238804 n=1 Tax=Tachypleus tridentatus TaxID=6853 RepID=UPI003FD31381